MDTDTIVAALRSPSGASAALLRTARAGRLTLTATVPLCLEYEAVCTRAEHIQAAGLTREDVALFLDAIVELIEPASVWFLWRPQLRDPGNELVLEAGINGQANGIVTFNRRDFGDAAHRFGVEIMLPAEALRRTRL